MIITVIILKKSNDINNNNNIFNMNYIFRYLPGDN